MTASPSENSELFYGAIGGYGAIGVIADVTLDLAVNTRVRRTDETITLASYPDYVAQKVSGDQTVIFHNADIYPPAYDTVHAVSYHETTAPLTVSNHLLPLDQATWTHRGAYSMIASWPGGKWMRQHILDPILFRGNR